MFPRIINWEKVLEGIKIQETNCSLLVSHSQKKKKWKSLFIPLWDLILCRSSTMPSTSSPLSSSTPSSSAPCAPTTSDIPSASLARPFRCVPCVCFSLSLCASPCVGLFAFHCQYFGCVCVLKRFSLCVLCLFVLGFNRGLESEEEHLHSFSDSAGEEHSKRKECW